MTEWNPDDRKNCTELFETISKRKRRNIWALSIDSTKWEKGDD